MSPHKCQICGRRKGLRKDGGIVHHHVAGLPCLGAGFPPIEQTDARLIEVAKLTESALDAIRAELRGLEERRANWIDPALTVRRNALQARLMKLRGRIRWLHSWPARSEREWDRYGWRSVPFEYLTARQRVA